jgi:hypothetical protein
MLIQFVRQLYIYIYCSKKSLKIRKGQSESVHQRRTDNTMIKGICKDNIKFIRLSLIYTQDPPKTPSGLFQINLFIC